MANQGKRMVPEYLIKKLLNGEYSVKLKDITNIQSLTDEQINELKAGDIVLKKTGDQTHAYIVTYKEENHGICISYFNAGYSETVSYDYIDGNWVYNSTDINNSVYTAGNNVQIENNVISATDTTYTAGSGIDITDGVISATGGSSGVELYRHEIAMTMRNTSNYLCNIRFEIYNNNNTPITNDILKALLTTTVLSVSGFYLDSGAGKVGFADEISLSASQYGWYDVEFYFADNVTVQTFTSRDSATYNTITDTVTKIL